jgi:hypothetical protein
MSVSKHWCNLEIDTHKLEDLNFAFANHGEEEEIYPLTTIEIAEAMARGNVRYVYPRSTLLTLRAAYSCRT